MATKKSTPKKTNTKTKTSVARTAGKGFAAGLNSTLGPDPKPYNRAKTSGTKTSTPKTSNASTARGQRLNSSASMPKGVSGRIDRRADGSLVTEPPKSSARANVGDAYIARDGVRNTLTGELISKPKSNRKRFLPVDHGAAGELPTGATSAKYDSYTGKFVPVYESGSKKKKK